MYLLRITPESIWRAVIDIDACFFGRSLGLLVGAGLGADGLLVGAGLGADVAIQVVPDKASAA
jgi:hypothetical protein